MTTQDETGLREPLQELAQRLVAYRHEKNPGTVLAMHSQLIEAYRRAANPAPAGVAGFIEESHAEGDIRAIDKFALTSVSAANPAPAGPRLFEAVRQYVREGIDAPGVIEELHAAFYEQTAEHSLSADQFRLLAPTTLSEHRRRRLGDALRRPRQQHGRQRDANPAPAGPTGHFETFTAADGEVSLRVVANPAPAGLDEFECYQCWDAIRKHHPEYARLAGEVEG